MSAVPSPSYAERMDELGTMFDRIGEVDRELATVAAHRAELIEGARRLSVAHARARATESTDDSARLWDSSVVARRELISELACVLRLPERTTGTLIEISRALLNELAATHAALRAGEISYRHAEVMADHASTLPIVDIAEYEAQVLPVARAVTVAKFDRAARCERERRHPESIAARSARSRADRTVTFDAARDGMAWLTAYLPADVALAAHARLSDIAASLASADESRTVAQLRADVLCDLLIDGTTTADLEGSVQVPAGESGQSVPPVAPTPLPTGETEQADRAGAIPLEELALLAPDEYGEPLSLAEADVFRAIQRGFLEQSGESIELDSIEARLIEPPPPDKETMCLPPLSADAKMVKPTNRTRASYDGIGHGIRARVLVTVPVMTLLGYSDAPATLDGYGPIDPQTARELAANAPSFTRLLTHPETGAVLSVGRDRYAVPRDLRTYLQVRDETCRFPGCSARAARCDVDHTLDWQFSGGTTHDNLAHLCPAHHRLKHNTAWSVAQAGGGSLRWTSPTKRHHITEPAGVNSTSLP